MKNYKTLACSFGLAAALAISASPAHAQVAEAVAAAPIVTKVISAVTPKGAPAGTTWMKAEVVRADAYTIVFREQQNGQMIHTFTFAPEIKDQMQTILDRGGYQYGDKVNILYAPGQTVVLRIHGKPSKP
jgi:hypothetical protein